MTDQLCLVTPVHRWHAIDEANWERRYCLVDISDLVLIERTHIVRHVNQQPVPHTVLALITTRLGTILIDADQLARELITDWLEFTNTLGWEAVLEGLLNLHPIDAAGRGGSQVHPDDD